jgi:DNA-binding FadR family transcriptional regulator
VRARGTKSFAGRHVEIPAGGYAARRHTPDDLEVHTGLLERMERETDNTVWVELDSLFHIAIAQTSGNPVFAKVIEEIREALAPQSAFLNQLGGSREGSTRSTAASSRRSPVGPRRPRSRR